MRSLSEWYNDIFASTAVASYREDERIFRTRFMRTWFVIFLCVVAAINLASLFGVGANEYHYFIGNLILVNLISAIGLQLLVGFTGLLSLGHAAFMGVGAYTSALLITEVGCPFSLSILAGGAAAALCGLIVGIPSLRIKGFYLMVATLAFQFVIEYTIIHWEGLTRGIRGIELPTPHLFGIPLEKNQAYFIFVFLLAVFFMWGAKNLTRSKIGRAFIAVRDNDISAEIIGIPIFRYKLMAFAVSAFYAGVGGAVFAGLLRTAIPEDYVFLNSIIFLAMVLVGGLGRLVGTVFGVIFVTLVPVLLDLLVSYIAHAFDPNFTVYMGPMKELVFGGLIILFIIFEPEGLVGIWIRLRDYFKIWPLPYISE
ncbi:MAG: branched-chain amino acid ABC transporter permease [Deltaproteobacteria bacterium]|nr:branched-chain amino acid ABC transporter permease [Deltaproteobacteria bacterium]MBW1949018.1 branched-chain amino acid ABC transporter permease [Deltaproteobacteria bacterium]MBW2007164.1 branched-chain amino acid ABC transporter permease [Deltaproteobacteria bacterium]MBW2101397.1 branched-chain amino acid ABC transporter permease [Deltaproteobacteria bacterium]MBW2346947.1 branched-chain amino acid ABC transporter permease [Deltaproteobacteria bacterium]